jgi:hypothetical protein
MNRIEYIRYSHRRANSRVRAWIGSVRMRLAHRSRLLGWLWMVPASIFYALVILFSWLTFCVVLFKDLMRDAHERAVDRGRIHDLCLAFELHSDASVHRKTPCPSSDKAAARREST